MSESALSAYLRSVARLYPGGIPRTALAEARKRSAANRAVVFISAEPVAGGAESPFGDPAGELLRGAIEKGLKLPIAEVEVLRSSDANELQRAFMGSAAQFVVLLGAKAAEAVGVSHSGAAELISHSNKRVLCTMELSRSAVDAAAKKRFWQDLQLLLAALPARG